MSLRQCLDCGAVKQAGTPPYGNCPNCGGPTVPVPSDEDLDADRDRQAWAEDEADMQHIANEWDAFDRDPPGS